MDESEPLPFQFGLKTLFGAMTCIALLAGAAFLDDRIGFMLRYVLTQLACSLGALALVMGVPFWAMREYSRHKARHASLRTESRRRRRRPDQPARLRLS